MTRDTIETTKLSILDMEADVTAAANLASCMRLLMQLDFATDERFEPAVTELAYLLEHRARDAFAAWQRACKAMTGETA